MIVDRDATSVILLLRLVDTENQGITGVAFDDTDLALEYMQPGDSGFATLTLTSGTLGVYASASWVEVGDGVYQFCPPDSFIVSGSFVTLRASYSVYPSIYDTLMATGNAGQVTIDMAQATPAGSTTGTQLDAVNAGGTVSSPDTSAGSNTTAQWPDATLTTTYSNAGTFYFADEWTFEVNGLDDIPSTEYIYFSLKADPDSEVDSDALIQAGMLVSDEGSPFTVQVFNGAPNSDIDMRIVINYESYLDGADTKYKISAVLHDKMTALVAAGTYFFDIKRVGATSKVLTRQQITVVTPVTRAEDNIHTGP